MAENSTQQWPRKPIVWKTMSACVCVCVTDIYRDGGEIETKTDRHTQTDSKFI